MKPPVKEPINNTQYNNERARATCAAVSPHIAGVFGRECSEQKTPGKLEKVPNGTFSTLSPENVIAFRCFAVSRVANAYTRTKT